MAHDHGGSSASKPPMRRVLLVLCLTATYMIAEAVGGFLSNSLSLLADAGHMLADVAALCTSLFAFVLSSRPPSSRATFGYYRAEVIAAFFNGLILLIVAFFIIKEAIMRCFFEPAEVESGLMIGVALGGLVINIIGLSLLHRDKSSNLNVRGAWLHVLSDTLGSVGVLISGTLISVFGWWLADPIASIIIAALVSYSSLKLILDTLNVLMEHTPAHIDPQAVTQKMLAIPSTTAVHDLHIWSITSGKEALSAHVVVQKGANNDAVLHKMQSMLAHDFGIEHVTIQIESECLDSHKVC